MSSSIHELVAEAKHFLVGERKWKSLCTILKKMYVDKLTSSDLMKIRFVELHHQEVVEGTQAILP